MVYGQGKDIQANYRAASKHGSGLNGLILGVGKIIEGGVNLGFGAQQGNPQKAMQGATTISQGFGTIGNGILTEVQAQRQGLNLNMNGQPVVNPMIQQYNNQPIVNNPLQNQNNQQIQNQQNAQMVAEGFDMNAGFNPQSGIFHDGSGNTVSLEKQATFQQLTPQQTQMINSRQLESPLLLANNQNQKVMNYLNYVNL